MINYSVHESAYIDNAAIIGEGTKIWHFCHVYSDAQIGKNCIIGQNVSIAGNVKIGNNVKIQNNVSIYDGTIIEDDVFLGPSCVLTNVTNPRSQINRHSLYEPTTIRIGASIGANATIVCGVNIGCYAFVAAGAVVTKCVNDYTMVMGVPAKMTSYVSRHGHKLYNKDGHIVCPESGFRYHLVDGVLKCLDLGEYEKLPDNLAVGSKKYREFKS